MWQLVNKGLVGGLLASDSNLTLIGLNRCLVEGRFIYCDLVSKGGVADQFDPISLILVVDDSTNLASWVENVDWLVEVGSIGMKKNEGQTGGRHSGSAGVGKAHPALIGPDKKPVMTKDVGKVNVNPVAKIRVLLVQTVTKYAEDIILEGWSVDKTDQVGVRNRNGTES